MPGENRIKKKPLVFTKGFTLGTPTGLAPAASRATILRSN